MSYFTRKDILDELQTEAPNGNCLDGEDYETGAVEAAQDTATNTSRALVRLIKLLINKKLITLKEGIDVLHKYGTTKWESDDPKITPEVGE